MRALQPLPDSLAATDKPFAVADAPSVADSSSGTMTSNAPAQTGSAGRTSEPSSTATSSAHSPVASRDGSPIRHPRDTSSTSRTSVSRSRKNSQQDLSPTRRAPTPSQEEKNTKPRTLSAASTPALRASSRQPSVQAAATPQKSSPAPDLKEKPQWPVSPRLRSPPPLSKSGTTTPTRRKEPEAPAITLQRPSPSPLPSDSQAPTVPPLESDTDESLAPSGTLTPARGPLETVQEVSQNASPAKPPADAGLAEQVKEKLVNQESHSDGALSDGGPSLNAKTNATAQPNSSDAAASKADSRRTSSVPPPPLVSRQSSAMSTKQAKGKQDPATTQSMTVETETVASIPQVALTTGGKDTSNGTLKAKPSSETIKPKKDRKRSTRKTPTVNSGTAASKADNFEAKIASAVDEADTSDSEETFVYDSNPPDNAERTNRRFHSRTPSATSMVSQADRQNLRSIYGVMEGGSQGQLAHSHGPVPKKSMKAVDAAPEDLAAGLFDTTITSDDGDGSQGNGHASLFDNESPFPNAARSKLAGNGSRNSSGPTSPRTYQSMRGQQLNSKRSAIQMSSSYDMDETGADDERTPLVGTVRSTRGNRRRGPHNLRQAESQTYNARSSYLNRFAACLVLTMMLLLVITGAIGFMFATSQPMTDIEIVSIDKVVTSQQLLMFDLTIKAHNPNIVVVTVDQSNLEIFAKSDHADKDSDWWRWPGTEPDDDDESRPNILLGRITEFDSPLNFEGSLFHQGTSKDTGELQLANPLNGTEKGEKQWRRIYENEFDLVVKGVVKYSLPLSARVRSATVSGRATVKPNSASDPPKNDTDTAI